MPQLRKNLQEAAFSNASYFPSKIVSSVRWSTKVFLFHCRRRLSLQRHYFVPDVANLFRSIPLCLIIRYSAGYSLLEIANLPKLTLFWFQAVTILPRTPPIMSDVAHFTDTAGHPSSAIEKHPILSSATPPKG